MEQKVIKKRNKKSVISKEKLKSLSLKYTNKAIAKKYFVTVGWIDKLKKRYGLVKERKI